VSGSLVEYELNDISIDIQRQPIRQPQKRESHKRRKIGAFLKRSKVINDKVD
jgi:hypothetical protein